MDKEKEKRKRNIKLFFPSLPVSALIEAPKLSRTEAMAPLSGGQSRITQGRAGIFLGLLLNV